MIDIAPLDSDHLEEATALFVAGFRRLRAEVPALPNELENPLRVAHELARMAGRSLVALDHGECVGYLAWWVIDRFRGSDRRGAYAPEWGHAALPGRGATVYRALYRAASEQWTAAACGVHAITVLASDVEAREAWFWNGFGLAVVDAVREARPLPATAGTQLTVRPAVAEDAEVLAALDAEHVRHYTAPPVFMAPPSVDDAAWFAGFLERPKNGIWMAFDGAAPAGFMRFSGYDFDAVAVLQCETAAFCNGAYLRSAYRGQRAGVALLQAALRHYASLGFTGVYTTFESFNPEAAGFWPRYFQPACLSLMRVPEVLPTPA